MVRFGPSPLAAVLGRKVGTQYCVGASVPLLRADTRPMPAAEAAGGILGGSLASGQGKEEGHAHLPPILPSSVRTASRAGEDRECSAGWLPLGMSRGGGSVFGEG